MIGPTRASIANRPHSVVVQLAGPAAPDGDGGFVPTWIDALPLTWQVGIRAADAGDLEYAAVGTTVATPTHIVTGPYRADITRTARLLFGARVLEIARVVDVEERQVDLELACKELLP